MNTGAASARIALFLVLVLLAGCQYVGDRALDFVDQFRVNAGAGTAVGVRGCALGLVDTGVMLGVKPRATALGLRYGTPLYLHTEDDTFDADQAELVLVSSLYGANYARGSYKSGRSSFFLLPAAFTWVDSTPTGYEWVVPEEGEDYEERVWLWSGAGFDKGRYAQVHAFDVEVGVGFALYLDLGYSPGELVDFLLGILTIDIARDDGRL